jgi:molybdopterin biosynthesis enzyme
MAAEIKSDQRIARLTPLADVLAHIQAHVKPVRPEHREVSAACGLTLAEDVHAAGDLPGNPIALRDGYAVASEATRDASSYAPVTIATPVFVNVGDVLPSGADSVLPEDAVVADSRIFEIHAPATVGDNVLPKGADADPADALLRSGHPLRNTSVAILHAAGVAAIAVRVPRIAIQCTRRTDRVLDAAMAWMTHAIAAAGGHVVVDTGSDPSGIIGSRDVDAAIVIGGTGTGQHDRSVATLANIGGVAFHGIAISPGETTALGHANGKPVLLVPGRLDAAIACWFLLGEKMLGCLSGGRPQHSGRTATLTRKVASSLGVIELVPVTCNGEQAEPLASNYLSLQALGRANGWISVPAQSEGYPAGTSVVVRSLP